MISHQCPKCGSVREIPEKYAGQKGSCRKCGGQFVVPDSADPFAATDRENGKIDADHRPPPPVPMDEEGKETPGARKSAILKRIWITLGVVYAIVLGLIILGSLLPEDGEEQRQRDLKQEEQDRAREEKREHERLYSNASFAYQACKDFVKAQLRAPSTAKFPWAGADSIREIWPGVYAIAGHLDAQNAFGAMVRMEYRCNMHYIASRGAGYQTRAWNCDGLLIEER